MSDNSFGLTAEELAALEEEIATHFISDVNHDVEKIISRLKSAIIDWNQCFPPKHRKIKDNFIDLERRAAAQYDVEYKWMVNKRYYEEDSPVEFIQFETIKNYLIHWVKTNEFEPEVISKLPEILK